MGVIETIVFVMMCLLVLVATAYGAIATICTIKRHKAEMRVIKSISEKIESGIIKSEEE